MVEALLLGSEVGCRGSKAIREVTHRAEANSRTIWFFSTCVRRRMLVLDTKSWS